MESTASTVKKDVKVTATSVQFSAPVESATSTVKKDLKMQRRCNLVHLWSALPLPEGRKSASTPVECTTSTVKKDEKLQRQCNLVPL